jgi:3-hexulose-6-phosphate synthase/6-phospho-3-hexuloisomerase
MRAVRKLREDFPDKVIVADLKTLSNSSEEVAIAALAGADIVGISGASDDKEIGKAVGQAKKMSVRIMADLIAISDPVSRAIELENLGADVLEFHISIDKQLRSDYAKVPFPLVKEVCDSIKIPVAVAGGMKVETAPLAVKSGAKIVVVGGGITHAADPKSATENIKRAIRSASPNWGKDG